MIIKWLKGSFTKRPGRMLGAIVGIAITMALLSAIGSFISWSGASMTARAIQNVPVDWQVQMVPGVSPDAVRTELGKATSISDAFFGNKNASGTLAALQKHKDGVLVSEETIRDFQLKMGDPVNLRLQFAGDHAYHLVPFHIVGIVREFPTAPKDSFFVTNASYIAQATGNPNYEVILLRAARISKRAVGLPRNTACDGASFHHRGLVYYQPPDAAMRS